MSGDSEDHAAAMDPDPLVEGQCFRVRVSADTVRKTWWTPGRHVGNCVDSVVYVMAPCLEDAAIAVGGAAVSIELLGPCVRQERAS